MKPIIRVENLSKQYTIGTRQASYGTLRESLAGLLKSRNGNAEENTIWALRDVSFDVMPGEVVGIIGRNGAGKSTLLKILSRIVEPTTGEVDLYGRVGSLLEVGTGFHAELTGRENIYLNGAILGMKRHEVDRKFDEIVAFSEVEKFIDTPVKYYSSGMYVRLAFSVAAHMESEVLIIDEVLAVGDIEFQKKCFSKMDQRARGGRTILFVSHNMNAIERICSSALLLDKGTVTEFTQDIDSVVGKYMHSDKENLSAEWVNTGGEHDNPWFIPLKFNILDGNESTLSQTVSNDSEMWVRIEGKVKRADPSLTIGYAIYTENGQLLYWSYHTDEHPQDWPKVKNGNVVLKSRLPKRFLNEGTYRLELIASLHFKQWLCEPSLNPPTVYLKIRGRLSESPHWIMKRPGSLAPVMKWIAE